MTQNCWLATNVGNSYPHKTKKKKKKRKIDTNDKENTQLKSNYRPIMNTPPANAKPKKGKTRESKKKSKDNLPKPGVEESDTPAPSKKRCVRELPMYAPSSLPNPEELGNLIIQALNYIPPPSSHEGNQQAIPAGAGDKTVPHRESRACASHPDPDPYFNKADSSVDPRESVLSETPRSRPRQQTNENGTSWREKGRDMLRSPSPRRGNISIHRDSDSEFRYHRPLPSRGRRLDLSESSNSISHVNRSLQSAQKPSMLTAELSHQQSEYVETSLKSTSLRHQAARVLTKYCPKLRADQENANVDERETSIFRRNFTFNQHDEEPPAIKMDAPYKYCYRSLDKQKSQLKPACKEVRKDYRFAIRDCEQFLATPSVPDVAFRVGDAGAKKDGAWNSYTSNGLRSRSFRTSDRQLSAIDTSARNGMKLAMYQGCLITALKEDIRLGLSSSDKVLIVESLIKISDLQYEQAARSTLLCSRLRRSNVMDALKIENEAARLLIRLPCEGKDLFNNQFQDVLDKTISASATADKTYQLSSIWN